jgi:hypothetical protein
LGRDFGFTRNLWASVPNENALYGKLHDEKTGRTSKDRGTGTAIADLFPLELPPMSPENGRKHLVIGLGRRIVQRHGNAKKGYLVEAIDANSRPGRALNQSDSGISFRPSGLERIRRKVEMMGIRVRYGLTVDRRSFYPNFLPNTTRFSLPAVRTFPRKRRSRRRGSPVVCP